MIFLMLSEFSIMVMIYFKNIFPEDSILILTLIVIYCYSVKNNENFRRDNFLENLFKKQLSF